MKTQSQLREWLTSVSMGSASSDSEQTAFTTCIDANVGQCTGIGCFEDNIRALIHNSLLCIPYTKHQHKLTELSKVLFT